MSGYDDDERDMSGGFDIDSGSGGSGARSSAAVAQLIDDLRGLADLEPPVPSPELAAVLAGTARPPHIRRPARARVVAAVAACAVLGGAGVAAAQGRLPQPAQRVVSDFVDTFTPFTVPPRAEPELPRRTVPEEPARRPGVVPPGVGRHSDDGPGDDMTPSPERDSGRGSADNEGPDPAPARSGGGEQSAENEAPDPAPAAGGSGQSAENETPDPTPVRSPTAGSGQSTEREAPDPTPRRTEADAGD